MRCSMRSFHSLVVGHRSNLVFGTLNGLYVVCMQGRFHPYEGYTTATVRSELLFCQECLSFSLVHSVPFQCEWCVCLVRTPWLSLGQFLSPNLLDLCIALLFSVLLVEWIKATAWVISCWSKIIWIFPAWPVTIRWSVTMKNGKDECKNISHYNFSS